MTAGRNSISNKKNSLWISLILIFISYLFFGSVASFQISDSIPQNIKMQKKINKVFDNFMADNSLTAK